MDNLTSRWILAALLALCASGCLAERASTAELKAAAAAAKAADATLAVGLPGDGTAADGLANDSLEDSATNDDSVQLAGDETAGDVAILADAEPPPADVAPDGIADATPDAVDGSAGADGDTGPPCPAGSPCNDGDPCTVTDTCTGGICAGKPKACSKLADACHSASCGPGGECVVALLGTCNDGNPCTDDGCDDKAGCTHADNSAACSDGDACTVGDQCAAGKCAGGLNKCGCTADGDCASKEDGDLCNGTLYCDKSAPPHTCKVSPASVKTCDASNDGPCEKTACAPASGLCVKAIANTGKACDADGSVCTVGDACKGGVCLPGSVTSCDDGNGCTADSCDVAKGCKQTAVADGTVCAEGKCAAGLCKPVPVVKVWPFGADGDLVFSAPNVITLDADSREPPIWDFGKCNIGGTLKIIGKKPWVLIGCAGDLVLNGTIDMQASYDVADYKDAKQPDDKGNLVGPILKRVPDEPKGGTAGGDPNCAQSMGNGCGGAARSQCTVNVTYSSNEPCVPAWTAGGPAKSTAGGAGVACPYFGLGGGVGATQNGTAGQPGAVYITGGGTGKTIDCLDKTGGSGGGGGGFRARNASNLFLQAKGGFSGSGSIASHGQLGGAGGSGGAVGGVCSTMLSMPCTNNTMTCWSYFIIGGSGGGGGGAGGAGGKLVLRSGKAAALPLPWLLDLAGGDGGKGGAAGDSGFGKTVGAAGGPGSKGAAGVIDMAIVAQGGTPGSKCAAPGANSASCQTGLSCSAVCAGNMCTNTGCQKNEDCGTGSPATVCATLSGVSVCVLPCGADLGCDRDDFLCDAQKGACIPDCRVQTGGFCPYFKTCDAKTGLCADVPCSGTCTTGNVCWSNACSKQVCTPDCAAAVAKACTFDIDCPSGVCLSGQCAACPTGSKCQAMSKTCAPDGAAPACVP